jgi:hypothetical protein
MFQFPGFASPSYVFRWRYCRSSGFPHSDIHGSTVVRTFPWLFAAYHVLHRLSAPRHPPNALKALDHSHCRCPPRPTKVGRHFDRRKDQLLRDLPDRRRLRLRIFGGLKDSPSTCRHRRHSNKPSLHDVRKQLRPPGSKRNLVPRNFDYRRSCRGTGWSSQPVRPRRQRREDGQSPITKSGDTTSEARVVEPDGIEPTTSCLQSRRSPN